MRVAWVVIGSLDQATGGYTYDRRIGGGLRARGYDVEVVSLERGRAGEGLALCARLLGGGFDVVVADELAHPAVGVAFAGLAAVGSRIRRVLLVHHLAEWEDGDSRFSEWTCLRLAQRVLTTSVTSSERLRRTLGVTATACLPGVEPFTGASEAASNDERRRGASSTNALDVERNSNEVARLLFVGTITPRKRLHALIRALNDVEPDNFRLTIVGDEQREPRYATQVRELLSRSPRVRERTTWLGCIDEPRLRESYRRSDVLVSVSSFEGYGMAIAEAVSAGLGVLCTNVGAVSEVVRHGEEAWLVPLGDEDALRVALTSVIADRSVRTRMRQSARKRRFATWEEAVTAFAQCL